MGERSGRPEESLRALSHYYEGRERLCRRIRGALLYPAVLLILMLVVIVVLLAKVLPVFNEVFVSLGGTLAGVAGGLLTLGRALNDIMLDTKGPEIRLKSFASGTAQLKSGGEFTLTIGDVPGDENHCSITYPELPQDVKEGDSILLDDGLIRLTVLETTSQDIRCRVENSGVIKNNKGVNVPGTRLSMKSLARLIISLFLPPRH